VRRDRAALDPTVRPGRPGRDWCGLAVLEGVREHRGLAFVGAVVLALGLYGFVATLQPDPHFGRILAAYGGVFVVGSLAWGMAVDGFRPDRYDLAGAALCLAGVAVIMYAPRTS
jgi:small multidrug resistance family-3 protein